MKPLSCPVATSCSSRSAAAGSTSADMIWPPSKPISIRIRSSAMCHQLAEDAVNSVGMEEGYLEPEETRPGLAVDELDTVRRESVQLGLHVVDLERDVVHPGPALGHELADGRVLAERAKQLDPALADEERRRLDALLDDGVAVLEPSPEQPLVRVDRLVEILDRDAEVMDSARRHEAMLDHAR